MTSGRFQRPSGRWPDGGNRGAAKRRRYSISSGGLKAAATEMPPLTVAIFSAATTFAPLPARRHFFARVCAAAGEVWKFEINAGGKLELRRTLNDRAIGPSGD